MRVVKEAYQSVVNGNQLQVSLKMLSDLVVKESGGMARTSFFMINADSGLRPISGSGNIEQSYLDEINSLPVGIDSLACGLALPTGQPVITVDVLDKETPWTHLARKYNYRACWSFPIRTRENKPIGTFAVYFPDPRNASDEDILLADVVTTAAAVIISNYSDNLSRGLAEKALRASEMQLSSLVEAVPAAIGLIDTQGNVILGNKDLWRFLPNNKIPSKDRTQVSRWLILDKNGDPVTPEEYPAQRALRGEFVEGTEALFTQDDGRQVWTRISCVPIKDENGIVTGSVVAVTDINVLKRFAGSLADSEQRFRALVEGQAQAIWETNAAGEVVDDSPSWRRYTGQTVEETVGYGWLDAIHPDDRTHAEKQWRQAMTDKRSLTIEVRLRHGDDYRWTNIRATPIVDALGNVQKWTCMNIDIHQRKEAEHFLKDLNRRLQEMDKAKTNFFNNVSHEFRTPLALLMGPMEELMKGGGGSRMRPEEMHKIEFVYRSAIRLQKLVNTLLDFARIEEGKLEAFYQPTDLTKLTADLASNFRSAIEKAGLKFTVKGDTLTTPVYVNHEMWEKILFNLLSNAFKFTQKGKIEVRVREKKKRVELHVKDTGIGIAPRHMGKIFERFNRIEVVNARTYEGTGIGLALVRELVSTHGGTIKVKSKEGVGSEFIVSIPKGKAHLPPQQVYEHRENLTPTPLSKFYIEEVMGWLPVEKRTAKASMNRFLRNEGTRVLVVEDNADMREYLTKVLQPDFQVMTVEHGQKVIDFLEQGGQPDLILADIMMPGIDGFKMVEKLKANEKYSNIPVVFLTARANEEARIAGLNIGADDYVVKPFSANELRARINARITASRHTRAGTQTLQSRTVELEHAVDQRSHELEELNESLKQRNLRLTSMNEELNNFAFVTSHDLREPLRKIQLYANEIASREATQLSERGKAHAERIISAALRMNELIEDVLTYSKVTAQPRKVAEADLNQVLSEAIEDLSELILSSGAKISSNMLPTLNCNRQQIRQLFENLLSNAIKFQAPGNLPEITITGNVVPGETIALPQADPKLNYVKLEVADNGIGIEERYLDKIFGIFQRLHIRGSYPGTGIGLALCKKIAEHHDGFMLGTSTLGKGSTFTCFIPTGE